jgi:uncharacterized protein (DUF849 family)
VRRGAEGGPRRLPRRPRLFEHLGGHRARPPAATRPRGRMDGAARPGDGQPQGEEGILGLCELLAARGIGIEAGLLSLDDARAFLASGIAARCARAMVEPLDPDPQDALAHAEAIERALAEGGVRLEQVHHSDGIASWAVNRRAIERGHGIRTGLEDTPFLPDGRVASGNGELVAAAASLVARGG